MDPYSILSIPKDADLESIKSAYKSAVLKCHPDKVDQGDDEAIQSATQQFQLLQNAYKCLLGQSAPDTPAAYKRFDFSKKLVKVPQDVPTIKEAVLHLPLSGGVVEVAAGEYDEVVVIAKPNVTIVGESSTNVSKKDAITEVGDGKTDDKAVVTKPVVLVKNKIVVKSGGVVLRNIAVKTTCPGGAVSLKEISGTATVENCEVSNPKSVGIVVENCRGSVTLRDNFVHECRYDGISFHGDEKGGSVVVDGNVCTRNGCDGLFLGGKWLAVSVSNNKINNNQRHGIFIRSWLRETVMLNENTITDNKDDIQVNQEAPTGNSNEEDDIPAIKLPWKMPPPMQHQSGGSRKSQRRNSATVVVTPPPSKRTAITGQAGTPVAASRSSPVKGSPVKPNLVQPQIANSNNKPTITTTTTQKLKEAVQKLGGKVDPFDKSRWMEVWCEEHKRFYYWDKKTGKTSWFAPTPENPSPGQTPEALTPEKKTTATRTVPMATVGAKRQNGMAPIVQVTYLPNRQPLDSKPQQAMAGSSSVSLPPPAQQSPGAHPIHRASTPTYTRRGTNPWDDAQPESKRRHSITVPMPGQQVPIVFDSRSSYDPKPAASSHPWDGGAAAVAANPWSGATGGQQIGQTAISKPWG